MQGVSLEISAEAGRTGADKRIEDKASASENAFNEEELSSVELKTVWFKEHTMAEVLYFVENFHRRQLHRGRGFEN